MDMFDFIHAPLGCDDTVRDVAATLLIDTLGVAAGAADGAAGRIARDFAADHMGAGQGAPLLFDGRSCGLPGAAFAAATQIDNLDAHDGFNPTKGHIGCAVVPALFAFASLRPDLTRAEALDALIMAYEVAARAGVALHATVSDYHTSGAWNALGVAALGARLLGLSRDQTRHALGIAEYHGPRSQMMREIANPTMLHDGSGMGAMTGVMAVLMAQAGFTGAPAITIEEAPEHWDTLGTDWTITRNYIKPYPVCRWAHPAIDAMRTLRLAHDLRADDVTRIEIETFEAAAALFPGMPDTTSQAQYALPFPVATMLVHGQIGPTAIEGAALHARDVKDVLRRISVRATDHHTAHFPQKRTAALTLHLKDGRTLVSGDTEPRGGPQEVPMSLAEVEEKFRIMCAALPARRTDALWSMRSRMANSDQPLTDLTALITPPV
ncbi:MmgE/PrpD family protein [uncultured Tateyamaria sp.]|uniref:MmgE/PrpD family protein n=1 Tax=uncultured Tateyamaria sp. TaxID=455651 RepID=UPI002631DF08|nr:MmgE/PrpD family protein [uncultured Tateyamaria sp.]